MIHLLVLLGMVAGYALLVLVSPTRACQSCDRYRGRPCPRCHGTGRRFRLGARLVHRGVASGHKRGRRKP